MTHEFVLLGLAAVAGIVGHKYHKYLYRRVFESLCEKGILSYFDKPKSDWSEVEKTLDPNFSNFTTTSGYMPHIKRLRKYLSSKTLPESDNILLRRSVLAYYCWLPYVLGFIIFVINGIYAESM